MASIAHGIVATLPSTKVLPCRAPISSQRSRFVVDQQDGGLITHPCQPRSRCRARWRGVHDGSDFRTK